MRNEAANDDSRGTPSRRWILVGVAALILGVGAVFLMQRLAGGDEGAATEAQLPVVETVTPRPAGRAFSVVEEGFLRPVAEIELVPEVSGKVAWVDDRLTLGGRFAAGEPMLRIEQATFEANVQRARADIESARAGLDQANATLARQRELQDIGATSEAALEQAVASAAAARAQLGQARAALTMAEEQLDDTVLEAPFDAVIARETVSVGQYVAPGTSLGRLFQAGPAEIVVSLSPKDAAAVRRALAERPDAPVTVRPVTASALSVELTGRVSEVASNLDQRTRTVDVLVRVPGALGREGAGEVFADDFVAVELPARSEAALYAAPEGVIRRQEFVWRVDDEARLRKVAVVPVRRHDDEVIFSADTDLTDSRLAATPLTEEAEGLEVAIADSGDGDTRIARRANGEGR
jgi:RND family efflux transporter MFP subunit